MTRLSARDADVDAIQSVAREAWHAAYDGILDEETIDSMLDEGNSERVLERMVALDEVGLFVVEDDGTVPGYASCGMVNTVGLGDIDVYVRPDSWGEGVGEQSLDRGLAHLAAIYVSRVQDEVPVDNDVGNAFYGKHFDHVGRRRVDFGGQTRRVNAYKRAVE